MLDQGVPQLTDFGSARILAVNGYVTIVVKRNACYVVPEPISVSFEAEALSEEAGSLWGGGKTHGHEHPNTPTISSHSNIYRYQGLCREADSSVNHLDSLNCAPAQFGHHWIPTGSSDRDATSTSLGLRIFRNLHRRACKLVPDLNAVLRSVFNCCDATSVVMI